MAIRDHRYSSLTSQVQYRHTILLADSGMGKTSFVLNYYARHKRKLWSEFKLAVVPLGAPDADALIQAVSEKTNTVLFWMPLMKTALLSATISLACKL